MYHLKKENSKLKYCFVAYTRGHYTYRNGVDCSVHACKREAHFTHTNMIYGVNLSNAKATLVQSTRTQRSSKPCHFGIHRIALAENSQMITHVPVFQSFYSFLHHFVLAKLATSSRRVKYMLERRHAVHIIIGRLPFLTCWEEGGKLYKTPQYKHC